MLSTSHFQYTLRLPLYLFPEPLRNAHLSGMDSRNITDTEDIYKIKTHFILLHHLNMLQDTNNDKISKLVIAQHYLQEYFSNNYKMSFNIFGGGLLCEWNESDFL